MRPSSTHRRRRPVVDSSDVETHRRHKPDYWLIIIPSILLVIGVVLVYSISPGLVALSNGGLSENYFVSKQMIAIFLGIVAFILASFFPLKKLENFKGALVIGAIIASIAVRLFGPEIYGAHRWLYIGGISFQAVEFIKMALLVWLASFLALRKKQGLLSDRDATLKPLMFALLAVGFVVVILQSDLGSAVVILAMMLAMSFVIGLPMRKILLFSMVILLLASAAISFSDYRRDRLMTFIRPDEDCLTTGYQACQALVAIGSGGMFGQGISQGVQAYGYLPQAADDSIFAVYAEKFGFIGTIVLLGLFLALFSRMRMVIERAPDDFTRLLAVGVLAWFSTQAIINIGAMLGLLPLKGITLPFISYGGTSIIFVMIALGIVFNISRYTKYRSQLASSNKPSVQKRGVTYRQPTSVRLKV
jgi:cell division protein FtsW